MCEYGFTENVDFNPVKNDQVQNSMVEYGFTEGTDFLVTDKNVHNSNGGKQKCSPC